MSSVGAVIYALLEASMFEGIHKVQQTSILDKFQCVDFDKDPPTTGDVRTSERQEFWKLGTTRVTFKA